MHKWKVGDCILGLVLHTLSRQMWHVFFLEFSGPLISRYILTLIAINLQPIYQAISRYSDYRDRPNPNGDILLLFKDKQSIAKKNNWLINSDVREPPVKVFGASFYFSPLLSSRGLRTEQAQSWGAVFICETKPRAKRGSAFPGFDRLQVISTTNS